MNNETQPTKVAAARSCPSAQPDMPDAVILGVRSFSDGESRITYLDKASPVTENLLSQCGPTLPTEVLRFAAPCEESSCRHFANSACGLATRIVQILPAVTDELPSCAIRARCRWFRQEGRSACLRCPQIITLFDDPTPEIRLAATPQ